MGQMSNKTEQRNSAFEEGVILSHYACFLGDNLPRGMDGSMGYCMYVVL